MTRSERASFLLQRKTIHAAVMAAETFIVNGLRMVPICILVGPNILKRLVKARRTDHKQCG